MQLYKILKDKNLVENKKDYLELITLRQLMINNKRVENPKIVLEKDKKHIIKLGILEVEL